MTKKQTPSKRPSVISVRPEQKLRYLLELAARHDQRPVANYIEWAINESFSKVVLDDYYDGANHIYLNFKEVSEKLWSPDEAGRLAKLAIYRPELMDERELEIWTMIADAGFLKTAQQGWDQKTGRPLLYEKILINQICPILRDLWQEITQAHSDGWNSQREWISATRKKIETKEIALPPPPKPALGLGVTF